MLDILFFIGILILCGFLGGKIANKIKFPAVVGYLIAGLVLGPSFCNILNLKLLDGIGVLNDLALALVAFIIGSEMRLGVLRKMGKGIIAIILSESFGAFVVVASGVYLFTHKLYLALIFGAMAPASAPAGTAVVLQEYKAKGSLTNAIYAVVGLDDGLAIMIYGFAIAFAKLSLTGARISVLEVLKGPFVEIVGSILLGAMIGYISGYFLRKTHKKDEILVILLAALFICTGISKYYHFSLILSNLSLGMLFANVFFTSNRRAVNVITSMILPVYIIFFVIAGAHLQINLLPAMGLLGIIYILCRITGLVGGAFFGAAVSKADPVIRKYLGLCILSQAGVAIGLAIMVTREFSPMGEIGRDIALLVINTIAATTVIFEIIGPIATKFAISKAGETEKAK
ncbi:MAG: cation:proton antiporter [Candidatus Makaraimicrobium thalassicum]|nr:MAG: cation:proton antiporter [Candidatus Omnitrophota bacterium]